MKPSLSNQLPLRGRVDRRGRVTIPKPIRDLVGMTPGKNVRLRIRSMSCCGVAIPDADFF